jgi:hypothetical protein
MSFGELMEKKNFLFVSLTGLISDIAEGQQRGWTAPRFLQRFAGQGKEAHDGATDPG